MYLRNGQGAHRPTSSAREHGGDLLNANIEKECPSFVRYASKCWMGIMGECCVSRDEGELKEWLERFRAALESELLDAMPRCPIGGDVCTSAINMAHISAAMAGKPEGVEVDLDKVAERTQVCRGGSCLYLSMQAASPYLPLSSILLCGPRVRVNG